MNMKRIIMYAAVSVALIAAGCTDFGTENQVNLPEAPSVAITNLIAAPDSISFTVAPEAEAGYYSWLVVEAEVADSAISATNILKLLDKSGVESGISNYEEAQSTVVGVKDLTPFTVYQIYAVASTKDGVVSPVAIATIRTLDDGSKPTPTSYAIKDTTVTLTFHEPLKLGAGKVFVSYFAKNTLSGPVLAVNAGMEAFNPQNIEIPAASLQVDGNDLVIELPNAPAGAYASITYEAGAVLDLQGNQSSAYTRKADTLVKEVPKRGITVHLANNTFDLYNEFVDVNPDTMVAFVNWKTLVIGALPDDGITIGKSVKTVTPVVTYKTAGKRIAIDVTNWGRMSGKPAFMLPEEPARGAKVDLNIPEGAYEDVYGNTSTELEISDMYMYSYGYTMASILGTYDMAMASYWDGALTETGIVLEKAADSDTILIKNLLKAGTIIQAVFDPITGVLELADEQVVVDSVDLGGTAGLSEIQFVNADVSGPVLFNVPEAGKITSPAQMWGYYYYNFAGTDDGWYDVYTESTWTRTAVPAGAPALRSAKAALKTTVHNKPVGKFRR